MFSESYFPDFLPSFLMERSLSSVSASLTRKQTASSKCNLLSFLATTQVLGIEILPITWQSARYPIGLGGTSQVNEVLANIQVNLAFKRVKDFEKISESETHTFQILTNEISVLRDSFVRKHPHIVQLEGICWDISSDGRIWPVLVFEKSQFGDLSNFVNLPVAREITLVQWLKICTELGNTLLDMHLNRIVHGDVKPGNVLIFKNAEGEFMAKLIDFGYSTRYASEDETLQIPISTPWNAPEHKHFDKDLSPSEARKMDYFSFGALFLWLLIEQLVSRNDPVGNRKTFSRIWDASLLLAEQAAAILEDYKTEGQLELLTQELLEAENFLTEDQRRCLEAFFSSALNIDQRKRNVDLESSFVEARQLSRKTTTSVVSDFENMRLGVSDAEFKIESSLLQLYDSDYKVRIWIKKCIEDVYHLEYRSSEMQDKGKMIAFQLALCYKLGFGIKRDDEMSRNILYESGQKEIDLDYLETQAALKPPHVSSSVLKDLRMNGHLPHIQYHDHYLERQNIEDAILRITQEVADLDQALGTKHIVSRVMKSILSYIFYRQGRWEEAERLYTELIETSTALHSSENVETSKYQDNLATLYADQGRWIEAEELYLKVIETEGQISGGENLDKLVSMTNLAGTYRQQGQVEKAEAMLLEVVGIHKKKLGDEHLDTLISMGHLAVLYSQQARFDEAERLQLQIVKMQESVCGHESPSTLISKANLASTYWDKGRWDDAATLEDEVCATRRKLLGIGHPSTLTGIINLATTYQTLERWAEAGELAYEAIEASSKTLGAEHAITLTAKTNLATTFAEAKMFKEAEELEREVLEARKRNLGENHRSTLITMGNLAVSLESRGRLSEAEKMNLQILERCPSVLGAEHPETLNATSNLAHIYWTQRRHDEALSLLQSVAQARARTLGEQHPDTIEAKNTLQRWAIRAAVQEVGKDDPMIQSVKPDLRRKRKNFNILRSLFKSKKALES